MFAAAMSAHASFAHAQSSTNSSLDEEVPEEEPTRATATAVSPADQGPVRAYQSPRNAGWFEPVWPVVGAFTRYYNTNIGYSRSLSRGLDFNATVGVGFYDQYGTIRPTGGLSLGLTVFVTGHEPMNGLFFAPKIAFSSLLDNRFGGNSTYFGPGLDVGYQYTHGGFFIASVIGVEWNVGFNASTSPFYATRINLAALRIGWTFDGASGSPGERRRTLRLASHEPRGFDLANDRRPRSVALWTVPVWMAIGPLFNRYNVGFGATVAVAERLQLVIEGSYEWGAISNNVTGRAANYGRVDAAVGAAIVLVPTGGLTGLFVQPKFYGSVWIPGAFGGLAPAVGAGFGLDIGYTFTAGPLYIAPVFGVRLGGIALSQPGVLAQQQPSGFYPELNFTVMRMGLAF